MRERPDDGDDRERLRLAVDAARLGAWEIDAVAGTMHISDRYEEILGLAPGTFPGTREAYDQFIHPDDVDIPRQAVQLALEQGLDVQTEYRIVRPDGQVRWIEGRGTLRVQDGSVIGSIGVVMDVTARRLAELERDGHAARLALQARFSDLLTELDVHSRLDGLADAVVPDLADCCAVHLVDDSGTVTLAAVRHRDPAEQERLRRLMEETPVQLEQPHGAGHVIASGKAQYTSAGYVTPLISRGRVLGALSLGRVNDVEWVDEDRTLADTVASTAAVAIDNAQLFAAERAARAASEHNERRLALLAEVTTTLVRTLDLDLVLDELAALLVPRLADLCTIDLVDEGPPRLVATRAVDDRLSTGFQELEERYPRRTNPLSAVNQVARDGLPILIPSISDSYLAAHAVDETQSRIVQALRLRSAVIAPVTARGRVVGVISMFRCRDDARRYGSEDLDLLIEIGRRAGLAIDNATLYGREHSLAEALQLSLLPEIKELPGLDIASRYLPSSDHAQVGGDWFDAFPLADGAVGLAVGDAMGHDPRATGAMGQLRSVLRSYAFEGTAPAAVLDRLDRLVQGFAMSQIATVFYGRLEPGNGTAGRTLHYCSAGHPPVLLRNPDGQIELLEDGQSLIIGAPLDDLERPQAHIDISAGAVLVAYTDGLVEGRDQSLDDGIAALRAAVESLPSDAAAEDVCDRLVSELVGADRSDDIALLVVRLLD